MTSPFTIKTTPKSNVIEGAFHPDLSPTCKDCDKIAFVQFIRPVADGRPITWTELEGPRSVQGFLDSMTYTGSASVDPNGLDRYAVDMFPGQSTPFTQEVQPDKQYGQKSKGLIQAATWIDHPSTPASGPKYGGFYDASTHTKGCKSVEFHFFTVAVCAEGAECGKWYESFTWRWRQTAGGFVKNPDGESELNSVLSFGGIVYPFVLAYKLCLLQNNFYPCSMGNPANKPWDDNSPPKA